MRFYKKKKNLKESGFLMFLYKNKIVVTGGTGRFGTIIKNNALNFKFNFLFPKKKELNILNVNSIKKYLENNKPKYLLHLAGLSRPMRIHDTDISQSIDKNIIGTANITKICAEYNIKLIYMSTCYVYPGIKGNYDEQSSLLPINNYAWSKLGGESSVRLYKNSLILRASVTEKPFVHKSAFTDFKTNFIFHEELLPKILKLLNQKGVVNIGGKSQSAYKFAKKYNSRIKKISAKKLLGKKARLNVTMNLKKFKRLVND